MAEAALDFTEHPGITGVNCRFEEGDHASPGLSTRDDFLGRGKVKE